MEYVDVDMVVTKEMVFARTYVQPGNSPSDPNNIWNIWQYEVNTSNFIPPAYQVTVTGLDPEGRQYEAVKPFLISYPVTPTSSQSPGFSGVLSLACALGVFAVFLVIPELIEARNFIKMRLDEMEREELFRMKRVKGKSEK